MNFVRRFAAGHARVLHRCRLCDDRIDDDAYRTELARDVAHTTYVHEECAQEEEQQALAAEAEADTPTPTRKHGRKLVGGVADQLRGEFDSIKRLRDEAAERRQRREAEKKARDPLLHPILTEGSVAPSFIQPPAPPPVHVIERRVQVYACPECLAEYDALSALKAHHCAADVDIVSLKRAPVPTGRRLIAKEEDA